jgi:hypothetical protein
MTLINLSTTGISLVLPAYIQNDLSRRQVDRQFERARISRENEQLLRQRDIQQQFQINRQGRLNELENGLRQTAVGRFGDGQ